MPQLCSWPNGGYNAEHVGPPVVAAAHPPGRLLAESIDELDRLIGTWGFISRLPLHLSLAALVFVERETGTTCLKVARGIDRARCAPFASLDVAEDGHDLFGRAWS